MSAGEGLTQQVNMLETATLTGEASSHERAGPRAGRHADHGAQSAWRQVATGSGDRQPEITPRETRRREGAVRWLDVALAERLVTALGETAVALRLWDGRTIGPAEPSVALISIADRPTLLRICLDPGLRFGEAFTEGRVSVDGDLAELIQTAYEAPRGGAARALQRLRRSAPRRGSQARSRHNVHHHYNLGNDFYRLWLDDEMSYTCAYFPEPSIGLEQAQTAKAELVCRKLRLEPGQSVVEAGGGWGALALHMARRYGVEVTSYNVSAEQVRYARHRAIREGLEDRVRFVEDDYRNIEGRFDAFVSVGMLEHVGPKNYAALGHVVARCLRPSGLAFVHSIGRAQSRPLNRWIERYIFPGAYPPTLREMMDIFEPENLVVLDVENLRLHYATTLEHWLGRFEEHADAVCEQFDERFERAWRLYLSGSVAAFRSGALQLFQVLFSRAGNHRVPRNRHHLVLDDPAPAA